ncbi:hypothetical protein FRC07_006058, partial [Ceratobasidium sp. 392]
MSLTEVIARLVEQGCANITNRLDLASCSVYPISRGGFGDIYRGKIQDGTQVAIKTTRLYEVNSNHQSELKSAARLVEFRGQIGMISTWEMNGHLRLYLEQHPEADRCRLSTEIADGLSYLHQLNIVHGDLKGANILISERGVPLLSDFGNSTIERHTLTFTDTPTKKAMSLRWAAPEVMDGGTISSIPADVYALGMTIL